MYTRIGIAVQIATIMGMAMGMAMGMDMGKDMGMDNRLGITSIQLNIKRTTGLQPVWTTVLMYTIKYKNKTTMYWYKQIHE